ncbi:MAG: hypothetical protein Q8K68_00680 [Nitrospirota bacterium]|nr:hypothetical protein [Nitrospirota bacterium]
MIDFKWSQTEKKIAREAFDKAYQRECDVIIAKLKKMIKTTKKPDDIWRICDYLTEQRDRTDEKYDYRYSVLIFVFARLIKEGWLTEADLEGIGKDKIEKVQFLLSM